VGRLAAEAAELAGESKTEAIRKALIDRVLRLRIECGGRSRDERISAALARFRIDFPRGDFGRKLTKAEEEGIRSFNDGPVRDVPSSR
jgi:hypothetical protein